LNPKTTIWLRGDGNSRIGLGHIHRLLALSELLGEQFHRKFVTQDPLPGIVKVIQEGCDELLTLDDMPVENEYDMLAQQLKGHELVVLDGYHFSTDYQRVIKERGCGLVSIDDIHESHFVADYVLNPAGGVDASVYSAEPYTQFLTGPGFAPVKTAFKRREANSRTTNLFICLGGADPNNQTKAILDACLKLRFTDYFVVVGEAYRHRESIERIANSDNRVKVLANINATEMAEAMRRCGVACCSASGIAYEYLSVGGELYLVESAANQHHLYRYLVDEGLAFSYDNFRTTQGAAIEALKRQQIVFDGQTAKRLQNVFHGLDFRQNVRVRPANGSDLRLLFDWANDKAVRAQSFSTAEIDLNEHTNWFNQQLADPATRIYIFECRGNPVASVGTVAKALSGVHEYLPWRSECD
jgi:UDP-2,4-diacetamido-2,4,6-trideoxy-beta-L-altropyranose hydrolase